MRSSTARAGQMKEEHAPALPFIWQVRANVVSRSFAWGHLCKKEPCLNVGVCRPRSQPPHGFFKKLLFVAEEVDGSGTCCILIARGVDVRSTTLALTRERRVVISVKGDLLTANVPQLESACAGSEGLLVDLTNLQLADSNGVEALKALERRGVQLIDISPRLLRILHAGQ